MNEPVELKEKKDRNGNAEEPKQPVKVVRRGALAASIWRRQAPSGYPYYDFSLSRSWKSMSTEKTGYSKNFFAEHAQELSEVIAETAAWIIAQKLQDQAAAPQGAMAA